MSQSLLQLLSTPSTTIGDVLAKMQALETALPPSDGMSNFNHLYLKMTEQVASAIAQVSFEDDPFMTRLDVAFADRYFEAMRTFLAGSEPSKSWSALFDNRSRRGISSLRFAVAGMNAHINFDLALALVATADERRVALATDTPQHRDYRRINDVLGATMPLVKGWFATGLIGVVDRSMGQTDDVLALWSIGKARDAAWDHAETLSALRASSRLAARYSSTLDRSVGLMGRALLTPQIVRVT